MSDKSGIQWTDVPGWPGFAVTRGGLISGPSGCILNPMENDTGHLYVTSGRKSRKLYVHRAVLFTFTGQPKNGEESRHLNGRPADNRHRNLAWGTKFEQRADDRRNGVKGMRDRRLEMIDAETIRKSFQSSREMAKLYGVSHTTIQKIRRYERYVR